MYTALGMGILKILYIELIIVKIITLWLWYFCYEWVGDGWVDISSWFIELYLNSNNCQKY